MDDIANVKENFENINNNFEYDLYISKVRKELVQKFIDYQNTMKYLMADAPIATLCLPPQTEKALLDHGCLRIYDLFDLDFVKVKGLGVVRIRDLTARLDQFFSML